MNARMGRRERRKIKQEHKRLIAYKEKFERARLAYAPQREKFRLYQQQFDADRTIPGGRPASSVYNFTRELIEAQIDSNIPQPSVQPRQPTEKGRALADIITAALRNEMDRLSSEQLGDLDERLCRIMGGSVLLTEWDNQKTMQQVVGALSNRLVSPLEFIPQEAVYDTEKMDHFFLVFDDTKERIRTRYDKDVSQESIDGSVSDTKAASGELVTQVVCFYRDKGCIGCLSWVGDTVLVDEENYFARKDKVCVRCGKTKAQGETCCPCGSAHWERRDRDFETLKQDMVLSDGTVIPALSPVWEDGVLQYEEYEEALQDPVSELALQERVLQDGMVVGERPLTVVRRRVKMQPTRLPYYVPKEFPIAVRRNTSVFQRFFGESDCAVIRDQQLQANKAMTKIDRKIKKTSEFFTKPRDLSFAFSNDNEGSEVLNIESPNQMAMINAITLQFDMEAEYRVIERAYYQAKSILGVSDSFQGKADTTAESARAKELLIAQAAGIQRSKRVMKQAAYADLFRNMFAFLLAFSDEPRSYTAMDEKGRPVEKIFNRYDFLEQDAYGNWVYHDAFLFSVDEAGAMQTDKRFLLEDVRIDLGLGAFGNPQDPETMLLYWKEKEVLGYPNAKRMVKHWEQRSAQASGTAG